MTTETFRDIANKLKEQAALAERAGQHKLAKGLWELAGRLDNLNYYRDADITEQK